MPSQPSPSTRRLLDFGAEHATHWLICAQVWSAQLNEAEYAPLLTAVLLYLNSEGVAAPLASTLAVGGQVIYFWLRAFVGHYLCETPRARHRADAATGATSRRRGGPEV